MEVLVRYDELTQLTDGFSCPAQVAGSDGKLARYEFPLHLRPLAGLGLIAPGRIETVRLYDAHNQPIARLSREHFLPDSAHLAPLDGGFPVLLYPSKDGSAPGAVAMTPPLRMPPAPGVMTVVAWGAFYTAAFFGLALMAAQLFAPGRSWDLRLFAPWSERLAERSRPWQLGLVCGLALAMAAVSRPNAHPDEYQHVAAARFYHRGNWLPPAMGDPRARDAIGPNGLSYHQDLDMVYLLAGKAAWMTGLVAGREDLALRLFNVALLATLSALACRRRMKLLAWMLLVCPQLWYVFSYFNGDAMGVFLAFLIVWQLAGPDTLLQRSLEADRWKLGGLLAMGALLGAVAVSKKNYFTLPLLAGAYAGWQCWTAHPAFRRRMATRWGLIAVIALSIYGARFEYDQSLYGFHKADELRVVTESLAEPGYRPSELRTPAVHWSLNMRERGVSAADIVTGTRWRAESFMSFVGLYGWMSILGPPGYYSIMRYLYLAFGAAVFFGYLRNATRGDVVLALLCFGLCGVALAASVYYSWAVCFQPQGRYLFPILPILAVLGLRKPEALRAPLPIVTGALIFVGSVYSFVFVALAQIPK